MFQNINAFGPILLAGIFGTVCMSLFIGSINRAGLVKVDLFQAIGSLFSDDLAVGRRIGAIAHVISGLVFAFLYSVIIGYWGLTGWLSVIGASSFIGAFHGFVLNFILVITLAEHNVFRRFRESGMVVAPVYLVAHIVYGFAVGVVLAAYRS